MSKRPMSLYVNNLWVRQEGRYWIAKAIAFSENGNDVTLSSCHDTPRASLREASRWHAGVAATTGEFGRMMMFPLCLGRPRRNLVGGSI
jgi:hypothetical protein